MTLEMIVQMIRMGACGVSRGMLNGTEQTFLHLETARGDREPFAVLLTDSDHVVLGQTTMRFVESTIAFQTAGLIQ